MKEQHIKMFVSHKPETLEKAINDYILKNKLLVVSASTAVSNGAIYTTVVFEKQKSKEKS